MNALIGARIRSLRENARMSQEALSKELDFSRQRLGRLENGEIDIPYTTICLIADILKIGTDEITGVAEEKSSTGMLFRATGGSEINAESKKLFNAIDTIFAHKQIYLRTKAD